MAELPIADTPAHEKWIRENLTASLDALYHDRWKLRWDANFAIEQLHQKVQEQGLDSLTPLEGMWLSVVTAEHRVTLLQDRLSAAFGMIFNG